MIDFEQEIAQTDEWTEVPLFKWEDDIDRTPTGYDHWREKRELDMKYCNHIRIVENPRSGKCSSKATPCNEPECKTCGPRMRETMRRTLEAHIKEQPLRLVKIIGTEKEVNRERARLIRKYGGKDMTYSTVNDILSEDGLSIEMEMLIKTDDEIGEEYSEVKQEDIERWVQKSYGHKKSGNLCKPSKDKPAVIIEEDGITVKVRCEEWQLDTKDKILVDEIESQVCEETSYLDPHTLDELEEAMQIRRSLRRQYFTKNGIVILSNRIFNTTVRMEEVNWKWSKNRKI